LDHGNVLEAHTPNATIIQARLDGYDVPRTQFLGYGANAWTLVHFQPKTMARAVKEALHPTTHLARLVALLDEKLLNHAMNFLTIHSCAQRSKRQRLRRTDNRIHLLHAVAGAPAHDRARDVA